MIDHLRVSTNHFQPPKMVEKVKHSNTENSEVLALLHSNGVVHLLLKIMDGQMTPYQTIARPDCKCHIVKGCGKCNTMQCNALLIQYIKLQ